MCSMGQETTNKAVVLVPSTHVKDWLWRSSDRLQNRLKDSDFILCIAYGPRDGGAVWGQKGTGGVPMGNTSISRPLLWGRTVPSQQAEDQSTLKWGGQRRWEPVSGAVEKNWRHSRGLLWARRAFPLPTWVPPLGLWNNLTTAGLIGEKVYRFINF